jgi:septum formation protein
MVSLILGSQSPRRREILSFFHLSFQQVSPDFDEEAVPFQGDPQDYVLSLAQGKADSLAHRFPSDLLLTADTIVYREGRIFGKPANEEEAFNHLKALIGVWHSVFTGLVVHVQGKSFQAVEETRVLFNALTDEQIDTYYRTLPWADKAGGYMIQGAGSLIVKRIEGCYYNVMGLPINALCRLLRQVGIDLWQHLKSG